MSDVLLTVAGEIPRSLSEEVEAGRRPRADYVTMAAAFDADIVDVGAAARSAGWFGRLLARSGGPTTMLAWHCVRHRDRYRVVFTDSENVGLPYAAFSLFRRPPARHVMIVHRMSARKKVLLHSILGLRRRIDALVVYSSAQRDVAIERLGYAEHQVVLTTFMVDTKFWVDGAVSPAPRSRPMICAVGQELRDYPTLVEATRHLDVDIVLAAASPWSKRRDTSSGLDLPANVHVDSYVPFDLRQLYADASLVVVPLQETDFQAGITTILEAMAMSRPVVCTRTTGQTDTIVDGETGRYVEPGDVAGLRATIEELLDNPAEARRLGVAGRRWVEEHADIEVYAERLRALTS
jgi:glycosyltransferase involved in cell wall biosynthesis